MASFLRPRNAWRYLQLLGMCKRRSYRPSYDKFIGSVVPGGTVIIDSTLVDAKCDRTDINVYYVPATALANEHDMKGLANIILVGKLLKETNLTSMETVKKAMEKVIPPKKAHLIDANIKAIELGMAQ